MKYKIRKKRLFEDETEKQSPVETKEQTAAKERMEKVNGILEKMKNVYWAISTDVSQEIMKVFPEFKNDADAKPVITAWSEFKKNPSEEAYNKFVDSFTKYGTATSQTKQEVADSAVKTQQQVESISSGFAQKLNEKMIQKSKQSFYNKALETGFFEPQMKF